MHYVLVEGGRVIDIINYEPNAPESVTVTPIDDSTYAAIRDHTHYFNPATMTVEETPKEVQESKLAMLARTNGHAYMSQTDWLVLRHIREQALNLPSSLTEEEYIALETKRHRVSKSLKTSVSST